MSRIADYVTCCVVLLLTVLAFRYQLMGFWRRYAAVILTSVLACTLVVSVAYAGIRWPSVVIVVLLTIIAGSLIISATILSMLYARLAGVNLHYVDFLLQNKRRAETPVQRAPYGMQ